MSAATLTPKTYTLVLDEEERAELQNLLHQEHKEVQVEVHRTHVLNYRKEVQHREDVLTGLIEKLARANG